MNWVRIVHQISCELGSRVNGDVKGWSIHSSINFLQKNWFQKPTSTNPQLPQQKKPIWKDRKNCQTHPPKKKNKLSKNHLKKYNQLTESGPFERPHAPPPSFQLAPLRFWNCTLLQSAAIAPGVRFGWKCVNLFLWHPCSIHTLSRFESKSCWTVWWCLVSKFLSLGFGSPKLTHSPVTVLKGDSEIYPGQGPKFPSCISLTWKIPLFFFSPGTNPGWHRMRVATNFTKGV